MKQLWQRTVAALTPGVRGVLTAWVTVYVAALAGRLTQAFDLEQWLAVRAADFWHGQVWRVVTYAVLPTGILDLLVTGFGLAILGWQLERHWSRREFWRYCGITATVAGLVQVLISPLPLVGAAPLMLGLAVAWVFVSGHETVNLPIMGQASVRQIFWIAVAVSLAVMVFSGGWRRAGSTIAGGVAGWLYLWLRYKWLMVKDSHTVESGRINRLEL
ncbi:MAG TPA: rhomboid family intramembrane serine protease [Candidatus Acidoferrales bacterium]|jgi:membrane associated rhomboid family serine protease|nr:rhomboid family intramembrane serine protease [Candidatus Acidoferrales bacterium]